MQPSLRLPFLFPRLVLPTLIALCLLPGLAACDRNSAAPAGAAASGAASGAKAAAPAASGPPVAVTTVRAQQRDLPVLITATGTVTPLASVDVRAQLSAPVVAVHVKEGQFIRKGDLLFTLDARAQEAEAAKARAQMARDEASAADARRQLARSRELLEQGFVSQGAVDTNSTLVASTLAAVSADRAALQAARVALSYARVTAPAAGRLGAIAVYPGSAVQANVTPLVTVTQLDPIAVSFNLPQRHLADALAALGGGGAAVTATPPDNAARPVTPTMSPLPQAAAASAAGIAPSPGRALQGRLQFVDNAVDAGTGTIKVKAVFDNPAGRLWPGAFVNVAMTASTIEGAVVVPQAAIIQSARGALVYVVQDGKAAARPLQVLYAQGDDAAVSGVAAGERVIFDGRQNVRPGSAVAERQAPAAAPGGSTTGPASAPAAAAGPAALPAPAPAAPEGNAARQSAPAVNGKGGPAP